MAAECHTEPGFRFQRKLVVDFAGGEITTDAGLVLLREFDERLGLTAELKRVVPDPRDRRYVQHDWLAVLRQRIYQIAAGYEDANDATALRTDPTLRAVVGRAARALASQPTLSRLENGVGWEAIRLLETQGAEWFCRHAVGAATEELILDVDATADPTHGQQAFTFFNAHYGTHMYYPLFIFDGTSGVLLAGRLRPGNALGTRQVLPLLRPLVRRLRGHAPQRPLALRADSEFAKPELLDYADYAGLHYAIALSRHAKLRERVQGLCERAERCWEQAGDRTPRYTSFTYQARSWPRSRRVVAKVERLPEGLNVRFVVTNRRGPAEQIVRWYEQRGQAENFIKELKNDLAVDRLSCSAYRANALRLQLHALAYNLLVLFRCQLLGGTECAHSTVSTLRLKLFKVAARVQRTCRRWWFHLASGWPGQRLFEHVRARLAALGPPT